MLTDTNEKQSNNEVKTKAQCCFSCVQLCSASQDCKKVLLQQRFVKTASLNFLLCMLTGEPACGRKLVTNDLEFSISCEIFFFKVQVNSRNFILFYFLRKIFRNLSILYGV